MSASVVDDLHVVATQSRALRSLAPTAFLAARNGLEILRVAAADRGWSHPSTPRILRIAYRGRRFELAVANRSEVSVVHEMLVEQQYAVSGLEPPTLILDLGSNIGASIAFFRAAYPKARIIGLEPDPATFVRLQRSIVSLAGVEVHPWAIAGHSGRLPFHQAHQSWGSALSVGGAGSIEVEVEAVALRDLLERLETPHVDLLKLDVEGAEWQLFDNPEALDACSTIVGELHLTQADQTCERAIRALSGFDVTIISRTATHANFIARRLA